MKITLDKTKLCEALQGVSRAVSSKSTLLALEGILLKAKGNTLSLTGYDLELGITTSIDAQVLEEGDIVLSAKLISDMARRMPFDTVTIESDEKLLTKITSGAAEYTILGLDAQEFPELPNISGDNGILIDNATLRSMIEQTLFAIAQNDAKPVHKGSLFEIQDGFITVVSVDGIRLALRREPLDQPTNQSFVVPGKTLSEIAKLLTDQDETVKISISNQYILFQIKNYHVISRLLEGEFLDYRAAIPADSRTQVILSTRAFIESLDRISLLISDKLRSPLRISFGDNLLRSSCSTTIGKANDEITCEKQGDDVEMGFNSKYLIDALRASASDEVILQLSGPLSPMKVIPKEGDSYLFLVLPVRLKND